MLPSEKRHAALIAALKEKCGEPTDERFYTVFPAKKGLWYAKPSTTIDAIESAMAELAGCEGEHEPMMVDDAIAMLRDILARAQEDRDFVRMAFVKAAHGNEREAATETAQRWGVDSDVVVSPF